MTSPQRPWSVPEGARFIPAKDWGLPGEGSVWVYGETSPRGKTGHWLAWAPDGRLVEDVRYVDDQLDGQCRTLHDDGTVAWDNVWERGRRRSIRVVRSENPTAMSFLGGLAKAVWSADSEFDDDGYEIRQVLRDRAGQQVDPRGNPAPPRPSNVPETARLLMVRGRPEQMMYRTVSAVLHGQPQWVVIRYDYETGRNRGVSLAWDTDGTLVTVGYHDPEGQLTSIDRDGCQGGNPLVVAARHGDHDAVATLLAHGAGASPHAAEHADYEGLPDLARRIRSTPVPAGGIVDPRVEPARPGTVPADARWVPGLDGWLRARLVDSVPAGTWGWWENDENPWRDEVTFVDGRRTVRVRRYPQGSALRLQQVFAPDGSVRFDRQFDRGTIDVETEILADGSAAERHFDDGHACVERVTAAGALVRERWWRADGTLAAEVRTGEQLVRDDPGCEAYVGSDGQTEWWRAIDAAGVPMVEGEVAPGLRGDALGVWRLVNPDGTLRSTVDVGRYERGRSADLGDFVVEVARWQTMDLPVFLAGAQGVPWRDLESCYGDIAQEDYPRLLAALTVPGGVLAKWALATLASECFHENTIYEVTGHVVRFVCAILESGRTDIALELVKFISTCASASGTFWLAKEVRGIVGRSLDKPLRRAVEAAGEAADYVDVYRSLSENLPLWKQIVLADPPVTPILRRLALHLIAFAPGDEADATLRGLRSTYETVRAVDGLAGLAEVELAELLLCLGLSSRSGDLDVLRVYLADPRPLVRLAAARTWVRVADQAAGDAVGVLLEALTSTEMEGYEVCYLAEGSAATGAAAALSELPPGLALQAVRQVCAVLHAAGSTEGLTVARALLDVVFPHGFDEDEPLTEGQRAAICAICDAPDIWVHDVDLHEVLRYNNLPEDRDALRALTAG